MSGVTILYSYISIYKCIGIFTLIFGISCLIIFCGLLLKKKKSVNKYPLLIILFCSISLASIGIYTTFFDTRNHIEYEVLVDDSVSFNDFHSVYEILGKRGKILIVKEKEISKN